MNQVSAVLRSLENGDHAHWCPGCNRLHVIPTLRGGWTFDGNVDQPTFSPSVRHSWRADRICHYFVRAGAIEFCADSTHELAGQTVLLSPLPQEID